MDTIVPLVILTHSLAFKRPVAPKGSAPLPSMKFTSPRHAFARASTNSCSALVSFHPARICIHIVNTCRTNVSSELV